MKIEKPCRKKMDNRLFVCGRGKGRGRGSARLTSRFDGWDIVGALVQKTGLSQDKFRPH